MPKRIIVLGSTGSIGRQTLAVAAAFPGRFQVTGLVAKSNLDLLFSQINQFQPRYVGLANPEQAVLLRERLTELPARRKRPEILAGPDQIAHLVSLKTVDLVVVAITGLAALDFTLKAIQAGKKVALASKEVLVAAGCIIVPLIRQQRGQLVPIDSEHSAILQCCLGAGVPVKQAASWSKRGASGPAGIFASDLIGEIVLTASGGPFWRFPGRDLSGVTPREALAHPNWNMGRKISIDSATLMNKGLEVIEAHWFYGLPYDRIKVVVHPQSYIHSLVKLADGSFLAQLSPPDMRLPIMLALAYPRRLKSPWPAAELAQLPPLEFHDVDLKRFPALALAYEAGQKGGTYPCVLNAANEVAVEAFLNEKIRLTDIASLVEKTMERHTVVPEPQLKDIIAADRWARQTAQNFIPLR